MMETVLDGFDLKTIERMIGEFARTRDNLRGAIAKKTADKIADKAAVKSAAAA